MARLPTGDPPPTLATRGIFRRPGERVQKLLHWSVAAGAIGVIALLAIGPAEAKTCSDRLRVCQKFCVRSEGGSPACMAVCGGYLQTCLNSGCWESKYVDKECGFTRQ
jgi:hypothetical protein